MDSMNKAHEEPRVLSLDKLKYDAAGLIPAVIQDIRTSAVLMVGYMNRESLQRTLDGGKVCFWSRSRKEFWVKGETSGNYFSVEALYVDCDADTLLVKVNPEGEGKACHTGRYTCFFNLIEGFQGSGPADGPPAEVLERLAETIRERRLKKPQGSYTVELLEEGPRRIARKLGEESLETILAYLEGNKEELTREGADLLYHLLVLLEEAELPLGAILKVLEQRGCNRA